MNGTEVASTKGMPDNDKRLEDMTPFERIERELSLIEWGDQIRDPEGCCPSCGRTIDGYAGRHAYGCSIRTIRDQLELIPEIYFD